MKVKLLNEYRTMYFFGRNTILPQDVLLDYNEYTRLADVTTPVDYSEEVKFVLGDVYSQVIENL